MSKKSLSKIKWTKKFTTLFVTLMVGLTAAVSGAAAALGVSMSDKGGQLDNGDNVHYEIGADGVAQPVVDISGNFASGGVKYSSNTTLRLTNDTTLNGDIYVVLPYSSGNNASMTFTLDLNGYVLNMNGHFIRTHFDGTPPSKLNQTYNVYVTDSNPNRKTVYFTQSSGRYVLNGTYGSNDTGATRAIRGGVIYGTDSTAPIVLTQLYTSTNKFVRYEGGQKESADGSIVWYEDEYSYYDVTYTPYLNNNLYLQGGTIAGFKYGVNIPANHYGVEGLYSDFDVMGTKTYVEAVPGTQKIQTNMYDAPGYPNICEYSVYNVTISGSRGDRVYYRGTDFIGNDSNINIDDYSYFDSTSDYSFIVRDNENGQYGLDLSKCTTTKDFGKLSAESEITIIGGYDKARISGVDAKDYLFYFNGGTSNSRGTLYNNNGTLSSDRPSGSYANGYTITAATTSLNYYGYSKYVLGSDIVDKTTSIEVPANAKVKIDLAGHVLATTGSVPAIKINAGATVHIYDSNPEGIIHRFSNSGSYYNFSSGTATFIGGVISAKGSSAIQFYGAGATLSMNGGALAGTYYHGIRSDYDNTNVYLRNVNVLRHDEKGIYLTGANSRLLTFGSMIAGNRKEGIWISQSSSIMKLYRTSVSYNKRTGIVTYANNNYFYDDVAYANPFVNDDCDNYEYDSTYIRPQYNTWGEIYGNNANSDQSGADMGGGIRCYGSLYLEGTSRDKVSVSNNETNGYGGGIYMASSGSSGAKTLSLKYADISNNRANTGDVYWDDDGDDNWDNYDGSGGGIYINGNVNYTQDANTTISGNYAGYSGGGIYYWSNSSYTMTINGGVFSGNTADEYDGGAIYLGYGTKLNCNVTSSNSLKIYNNKAGEDGGAISSSSSTVTMTGTNKNIEIYSNTATGAGAIYMSGGSLSLNNVKIYKNTANDENGALYVGTNVTSLSLVSTEITENKTTDGNYGGFYAPINFTIGGSTIVKSNRACDGEDSDITLAAGKYITISSALTANASNPPIGITFMSEGYAFTSYFGQRHSDRDINKYFYSHSGSYELVTIGSGTATEGYVKMLSVKRPTLATISEYTGSAQRAVNYSDYDIGRFWDATCVYTPFGGTAVSYGVGDTHNFLQDGITNAGTYVFTFTLHGSDHDWDNGTTTAYTLPTITLNKKQIAKPTQANTLTYNATKQAATFTTTGLTYGTDYTASDNEQINAGDYTATLTIASSKAGNYRWSGTTNTASASTTVSYKIDKVTITQKPAQSDTVLYYNGAEQEAKFATAPLGYGNVAMYTIAKATATNAGTYEAIASISDTTNYKWDNSFGATGESDPLTFNWKISPAKSFILDDITPLVGVKLFYGMSVSDIKALAEGDSGFLKNWSATFDFDLEVPEEDRYVKGTFEITGILDEAGNAVARISNSAKYLAFNFTPEDTVNFAPINGGTDGRKSISVFVQLQAAFHVFEYGQEEETKTDKVDIDYGDVKLITDIYNADVADDLPKGYYMAYMAQGTNTPIITLVATYKDSVIGDDNLIHIDVKLMPNTDTNYYYYIVKQSSDETFIGGDPSSLTYDGLEALKAIQDSSSALIFTSTGSGTTDTAITSAMVQNELKQDNENYLTFLRYCQNYMAVTINGENVAKDTYGNIAGDGKTIIIVYYKIQKYNVSFVFSGGTIEIDGVTMTEYSTTLPATATLTKTINDLGEPTRAKSEFDGWYSDIQFTNPLKDYTGTVGELRSTYGNQDIVIYAKWVASKAMIEYVYDYVSDDDTFGHYTAYSDGMYIVPANKSELKYKMTAVEPLKVHYGQTGTGITNLNGNPDGIYSDMEGQVVLTDKDNMPTADGYVFAGWYNDGKKVDSLDKYIDTKLAPTTKEDGKVVYQLVARWMPASYTVYFNADSLIGGAECSQLSGIYTNTTEHYGDTGALPTPSRQNYKFAGWYISSIGYLTAETEGEVFQESNLITNETYVRLTQDVELNALWVLNSYQLTYSVEILDKNGARTPVTDSATLSSVGIKVDGGNRLTSDQLAAMTFEYKQTAVFEPVVTDNRYRVLSLERAIVSLDGDGNREISGDSITVAYPATMSIGNLYHFTIVIELTDFSITYDLNGGNMNGSMNNVVSKYNFSNVESGAELLDVNEAKISRPGYEFVGWEYKGQQFTKFQQIYAYEGQKMLPITVKAAWKASKANITLHYIDDEEQWRTVTIESETDANVDISTAQIRNGFTVTRDKTHFVFGWAVNYSDAVSDVVSYVLSYTAAADYDVPVLFTYTVKPAEYGNDLWAVYRLQGERFISLEMSGPTEFTYDGEEHTLTATPLGFESLTTAGVNYWLTFQWYFNNTQYGEAVLKNTADFAASGKDTIAEFLAVSIDVKDAKQAGAYRCELDVHAQNEATYEHYEGTINVTINKAKIEGLTLEGGTKVYDGNAVTLAVSNSNSKFELVNNSLILADGTSAVITYTYTVDGVEVDEIKAAGEYTVTAHVAVAANGNYEKLDDIVATYTITPASITNSDIKFIIQQDGEDVLGESGQYSFDNLYNGKDFVVSVVINNIIGEDDVVMIVNGGVNKEVGDYEALIAGLGGEDADNYELSITNNSRLYSILAKSFNLDDVVFEDDTVTYDGTAKTLNVKLNGTEIAEGGKLALEEGSLTVNYQVTYTPNVVGYSATTSLTNGGVEAGVYKVTAVFTSDSTSFNKVSPITKTLTVTTADYFDLHSKENFVGDFVSGSREYDGNGTKFFLNGSEFLANESQFEVMYSYASVNGDTTLSFAQGNKSDMMSPTFGGVTNAGYYKITANVLFKGEANKNNYNEIGDIEIYYSIASTTLDHIVVTLVETPRVYKIGEMFDTADIQSIVAVYNDAVENEVSYVKGSDDEKLANCIIFDIAGEGVYENFNGFSHVGEYEFAINFLGKYATVSVFVQQDITEVTEWQYSEDGASWTKIPADGLEYNANGYKFRAAYECVTEAGLTETRYVDATVDGQTANENGYYVIDANSTVTLSVVAQSVKNDDETVTLYNIAGFTEQLDILQNTGLQVEWLYDGEVITGGMKTVKWNGTDFFDKLSAKVGDQSVTLTKTELKAAGTYEFDASDDPAFANYKLANATLTFVVAPFDINKDNISEDPDNPKPGALYTVEIQYYDDETKDFVRGRLVDYKSGDYTVRVIIKDLDTEAEYTVVAGGQKIVTENGNTSYIDVDSIKHAGTYRLVYSSGEVDINGLDLTFTVSPVTVSIEWSEDNEFEYDGTNHEYTVSNIESLGVGNDGVIIDLGNNVKRNAGTYTAVATLKTEFAEDYKILDGTQSHTFVIKQLEVELGWEYEDKDDKVAYNQSIQIPAIISTNLIPEDGITLKRTYKDANGNSISIFNVVKVGTYTVSVTLEGSPEALKNYSYTSLDYTYEIVKADLKIASLYYNEYPGVVDLAYTETALRPEKLTATFQGGMQAEGTFEFVMDGNTNLEFKEGKVWVATTVPAGSTISVKYRFTPTGESANYFNVLEGTKTLHIEVAQAAVGTSALYVEYPESFTQVAVGDTLDFSKFEVFKRHTNSYIDEDGTKHGNFPKLDLDEDLDITVEIDATHSYPRTHKFLAEDLGGAQMKTVTLRVSEHLQSGNYTTISITVIIGQPESIALATPIRDVWYVGETFSYSDAKFNLKVEDNEELITLNASEVSCDIAGKTFTEAGSVVVTFSFGTVKCSTAITVKPQVQFDVRYNENYYLKYTGDDLELPKVTIYDDGVEIAPGLVQVTYEIFSVELSKPVDTIRNIGSYAITAKFTFLSADVKYAKIDPVNYMVQVRENLYEVEYKMPYTDFEGSVHTEGYTGNEYKYEIEVTKLTSPDQADLDVSAVTVNYTITKIMPDEFHTVVDVTGGKIIEAGVYNIRAEIIYNGDNSVIEVLNYTISVVQAENAIKNFTVPSSVVQGGKFDVTAESAYGEIKYEYYKDGELIENFDINTAEAGDYKLKVSVEETYNWAGASEELDFTVTLKAVPGNPTNPTDPETGAPKVDIEAGGEDTDKPIGKLPAGTTSTVDTVTDDDLTDITVKDNDVLEGYDIDLKDKDGNVLTEEQLDGWVKVKLLISEEYRKFNNLKVFYISDDPNVAPEDMHATREGDYMVFYTRHFSRYIIVAPQPGAPAGLIAAVVLMAVAAAGLITASVVCGLRKKKEEV